MTSADHVIAGRHRRLADRFDRMSEAEFAEHLRLLEQTWRPCAVHSDYVPVYAIVLHGAPDEGQRYDGRRFTSWAAAADAADRRNYLEDRS